MKQWIIRVGLGLFFACSAEKPPQSLEDGGHSWDFGRVEDAGLATDDASVDAGSDDDVRLSDAGVWETGVQDVGSRDGSAQPDSGSEDLKPGVVLTRSGVVQGEQFDSTWAFRGIPFAAAPVGALRFREPQAHAPWSGVRPAREWPEPCAQMEFSPETSQGQLRGSEDCLYLNVWRPISDAAPRPVLVFIHGGGNQQGASSNQQGGAYLYEGAALARNEDVIVVTIQYRLGPLGFLARDSLRSPSGGLGNYGILDQQAAFRWVKENIAAFGGDPARVLIFGESAGAVDVCLHVVSPAAKDLFSAAIMQSGGCVAEGSAKRIFDGLKVVQAANCEGAADEAACLRSADVEAILSVTTSPFSGGVVSMAWGATIDGISFADQPMETLAAGQQNKVPLIVGSNADETAFSAPRFMTPAMYESALAQFFTASQVAQILAIYPHNNNSQDARFAFIQATTDAQFTCGARRIVRAAAPHQPVYRYFYNHPLPEPIGTLLGAFHGAELFFVFRSLEKSNEAGQLDDEDREVMNWMGGAWAALASSGDPNGGSRPHWPRHSSSDPALVIQPAPHVEEGTRNDKCDFWDSLSLMR